MNSSSYKSNIVESSWQKLHMSQAARHALVASLRIVIAFFLLFLDMSYSIFSDIFSITNPILWFIEMSVCVLLLLRLGSHGMLLCHYFWSYFFGSVLDLTEEQRRLMAIPINDRSFRTPQKTENNSSPSSPLTFNLSDSQGHRLSTSFTSPSPSRYCGSTSINTPGSMHTYPATLNTSYNSSFDRSLNLSGVSQSSGQYDLDQCSLRSRRSTSLPAGSQSSGYKCITDIETLNRYIREEEERERDRIQASPENLNSGNFSFWNYGATPLDVGHILRRFTYQLSPRSPASPTQNSSSDQTCVGVEEAWSKFGVTEDDLYAWTERLRKWLSFTIVTKLNAQVEEVNSTLRKIGCDDTQIGDVGVSTLKQLALTKGNFVPTLNSVVPYLDFCANQEYLVTRIQDLSTGSMSAFSWNRGGDYGKQWGEHLPTDASLVMHLFCCYLDSRLPAQPKFPDGKTFTSQHFCKTPDKPNVERKDTLQIYQSSINPPHFQVVIGGEVINLSKGRNNMFQAILLFLYHIKVTESGMLGRVNLGMSGLNMLWILD